MTEKEWLTATDPRQLIKALWSKTSERKLSERKHRLFAVACCRRIWRHLPDKRSREAIAIAELYADGHATEEELETASAASCSVWDEEMQRYSAENGDWNETVDGLPDLASQAAYNVATPVGWWGGAPAYVAPYETSRKVSGDNEIEGIAQCQLLREIFGNPFRLVVFDPGWRTPTVTTVAQTIYAERRFSDMPVLGDALKKAGCSSVEILDHCRERGEHVRGCWVVDFVLNRS